MKPEELNPLVTFAYRGFFFLIGAQAVPHGMFQPVVFEQPVEESGEQLCLAVDGGACATREEALRRAEHQALRWVHERSTDGRGNN